MIELDCSETDLDREGIKDLTELQILKANYCYKIHDVNHLKHSLIELECKGISCDYYLYKYINQEGIKDLIKIQKLVVSNNEAIYDVNHLNHCLIELDCSNKCGIDQKGISKLIKVRKLNTCSNIKINNVNHLSYLTELCVILIMTNCKE